MRFPCSLTILKNPLRLTLVLVALLPLTIGCATLSRAKISISSSNENKPLIGPRWQ